MTTLQLVWPSLAHLPQYMAALKRGWSPDNLRPEATQEQLALIGLDPPAFVAGLVDREALGGPIVLPDGSVVQRLPGYKRWLWDGEFCGVIGLRWQRGTDELPPTCPGHIGYAVVPWKRRRGYATEALRQLLPEARTEGLQNVQITTDPANTASQRVIEANGGMLAGRFAKLAAHGGGEGLRYRGTNPPAGMSTLAHLRSKIYKTVARQMHGVVPCWVCGEHVLPEAATLEHIQPLSEGGNSHQENLAISHAACNHRRHAAGASPKPETG